MDCSSRRRGNTLLLMPQNPTQQEMENIGNAVTMGKPILAIKLYREATGCGLRESKDFIENLTRELRSSQPERFAATAEPQGRTVSIQHLILWIFWFSIVLGEIIIYKVLNKQSPPHPIVNDALWLAGTLPAILSTINRWMILPGVRSFPIVIGLFFAGLLLGEASVLLGLVLFPVHQQILCALGFACTVQYAPSYKICRYLREN